MSLELLAMAEQIITQQEIVNTILKKKINTPLYGQYGQNPLLAVLIYVDNPQDSEFATIRFDETLQAYGSNWIYALRNYHSQFIPLAEKIAREDAALRALRYQKKDATGNMSTSKTEEITPLGDKISTDNQNTPNQ